MEKSTPHPCCHEVVPIAAEDKFSCPPITVFVSASPAGGLSLSYAATTDLTSKATSSLVGFVEGPDPLAETWLTRSARAMFDRVAIEGPGGLSLAKRSACTVP